MSINKLGIGTFQALEFGCAEGGRYCLSSGFGDEQAVALPLRVEPCFVYGVEAPEEDALGGNARRFVGALRFVVIAAVAFRAFKGGLTACTLVGWAVAFGVERSF